MSDGEFQIPDDRVANFAWAGVKPKIMTGVELIAQERLEQKVKHGRSVKFDAEQNGNLELAEAAVALITQNVSVMPEDWDQTICNYMLRKSYKDRLVIAGALIAAELDRLNFKK